MAIYALGDQVPEVDPEAWVSEHAVVIGSVTIGAEASVWPCAVLRGDYGRIVVGARTSVQDGSVLHATPTHATVLGRGCVIGHSAYLEGCRVEDGALIGAHASVLRDAIVRRHSVVGVGAVVTQGTEVPERGLALGVPARVVPDSVEADAFAPGVQRYVDNARRFASELRRIDV